MQAYDVYDDGHYAGLSHDPQVWWIKPWMKISPAVSPTPDRIIGGLPAFLRETTAGGSDRYAAIHQLPRTVHYRYDGAFFYSPVHADFDAGAWAKSTGADCVREADRRPLDA